MSFGLLSASDSNTTINTSTYNLTNSNNTTNSASNVVADSGNITLNLGQEGVIEKALPVIIVLGIFLVLFAGGKFKGP